MDPIKEQVVDKTEPKDQTPPKDTKYVSKFNNSVEQETKAALTGKTQNSQPAPLKKPNEDKVIRPEPKKQLSMADLGLKPQPRKPSAATPPSQTDDYLPEIKSGLETSLNTREFQFYSYFERIKDRLRMYWEPQLQHKMRAVYAQGTTLENDLITKLDITLTQKGELTKISIAHSSGIEGVDDAALKAFELAAPFPNPPTGMIEKNGEVKLTWSFVVQVKGLSNIFVFLSQL